MRRAIAVLDRCTCLDSSTVVIRGSTLSDESIAMSYASKGSFEIIFSPRRVAVISIKFMQESEQAGAKEVLLITK